MQKITKNSKIKRILVPVLAALSLTFGAQPFTGLVQDTWAQVDLSQIPSYTGSPYTVINDNEPDFSQEDFTTESFETYSDLDDLGRCQVAYANVGQDLMPTQKRGNISQVKPSGWKKSSYDFVDGGSLYNRCHLIGYQLTAENANEKNLITGTRYMNVDGMLPFENMVADYVKETGNHVLYRVTPVFDGDNLVASGVEMEAESVEDEGDGVLFHVYCYNVQPGVGIDYATGDNWEDTGMPVVTDAEDAQTQPAYEEDTQETQSGSTAMTYVINTNSGKFHYPDCASAKRISDSNREEYTGSREELIAEGYSPCGNCNP